VQGEGPGWQGSSPGAEETAIDAAALRRVLHAAGAAPGPPSLRFRPLEGGSRRTAKWVVETPLGPLVVKRRREGAASLALHWPQLRWRSEVEAYLHRRGIPVAEPPLDRLVEVDGVAYEIAAFVAGSRCRRWPDQVAVAAAMLGRVLEVLRELDCPPLARVSWHDSQRVRGALAELGDGTAGDAGRATRLACLYEQAARECGEAVESSARQLVHGDYHPGNLVVADGQVAAILDWEALRGEAPLLEVASAVLAFCLRSHGEAGRSVDLKCVAAFAGGLRASGEGSLCGDSLVAAMAEAAIAGAALRARRLASEVERSETLAGAEAICGEIRSQRVALVEALRG
jgi:hypothetical protein